MDIKSRKAEDLSIKRKRYLNIVGMKKNGVNSVRNMINRSEESYESVEMLCSGFIGCRPGDIINTEGENSLFKTVSVQYSFIKGTITTRITAEVHSNVDQQKHQK